MRKKLTKEYLKFLGIKDVLEDGTIIGKSGKEIKPGDNGHNYKKMKFSRPELGKPFDLYIHNIVYAWYHNELPSDLEVHHLDRNRDNNAIDNLVALTHREHLNVHYKTRPRHSTKEMKCDLSKPREYYEQKLENLLQQYNSAVVLFENASEPAYKALMQKIYYARARLRYWDSHNNNC